MFNKLSPELIKYFLKIFVPLALLFVTISVAFYFSANKARSKAFRHQEQVTVQQQERVIRHDMHAVISDLRVLVDHYCFHAQLHGNGQHRKSVSKEFLSFSNHKKVYDQLRVLDRSGMEIFRVDRQGGQSAIVPEDKLQDKGRRYYFRDTVALGQGEIYSSPFDLNIEQGVVEDPIRPMIRLGMPLFDREGENIGALIINYAGREIIGSIDKLSENSVGEMMLVNSEGYWLRSDNPENDWGFMYEQKANLTLGNQDRDAWDQVRTQRRGQFFTRQGLYTFVTLFPLEGKIKSSTGSGHAFQPSVAPRYGREYYWKLISFVSSKELFKYQHPYLLKYILINIFLVMIIGHGCLMAASASCKKRAAEKKLQQMATVDTLTGLPNRNLLYDRLSQTLARSKRNQTMFAILYLDLDRFKVINDTLGHKAGDTVLQEVARRMEKALREEDTVARMGGDEFVVVLQGVSSQVEAKDVFEKLVSVISQPISLDDTDSRLQRQVGVSGGISMYPKDGLDSETLLSKADSAMYEDKKR